MIHNNLNMIFYTHVEHSPAKTVNIIIQKNTRTTHTHYTHTHTHTHDYSRNWVLILVGMKILYWHLAIKLYCIVKTSSLSSYFKTTCNFKATFQPGGLSSLITVFHIQFTLRYLQLWEFLLIFHTPHPHHHWQWCDHRHLWLISWKITP